ncbi:MAG: nucleoside-diphosphate-sugar epimerase [Verrucomicrobiales bacterium]|jgi:nucleoside-diphosphate-sugar epimerase
MKAPSTIEELHEYASRPDDGVLRALTDCPGNVAVLGAGGKMGFHLARMVQRALETTGSDAQVYAVSRFSDRESMALFAQYGIETIQCDLADGEQLAALPDCPNVFFLGGVKFGTADDPALLHRFNVEMPALVAERFQSSRIVALSTGCVYPYVAPDSGGSRESDPAAPTGAYAESCLGRETAFVQASENAATPVCLIRLNYSVDLRYGVPVDIGQKVLSGHPVDVSMGYVNIIWQGDATRHIVRALTLAAAPAKILNITGAKTLSVREIATTFGSAFNKEPLLTGSEKPTAWINNPEQAHALFGAPEVDESQLLQWVADWLKADGPTLNKPTHFETRDGKY